MTNYAKEEPYFDYMIEPDLYVKRARQQLARFDAGDADGLFYAALELRIGIEAKLVRTIESARSIRKLPELKTAAYKVKELLKELESIDASASEEVHMWVRPQGGSYDEPAMRYTPVTPELARYYGKLGNLLHFTFFRSNPDWIYRRRLKEEYDTSSLTDYRDMVVDAADELEKATSGDLLAPPNFSDWMIKFVSETESAADEEEE